MLGPDGPTAQSTQRGPRSRNPRAVLSGTPTHCEVRLSSPIWVTIPSVTINPPAPDQAAPPESGQPESVQHTNNQAADETVGLSVARRYGLITGLYVTQFVGVGFLTVGLGVILRENGAALEQLAALTLAGLIWPLKFLWAPLVDRWGSRRLGHYRGWLLVLQPLMVLAILAMIPFDDFGNLTPLILLGVLLALLSATQDTASDALAVLTMKGQARGLTNGIQVMGGYLGNLLGGGVTVLVYAAFGWTAAICFLAVVTAIPLISIATLREERVHRKVVPTAAEAFGALGGVLRQPGAALWALLIAPMGLSAVAIASGLTSPALIDAGWTVSQVGVLTGVVLGLAGIVGGLLGGVVIRRLGRVATYAGTSILLAIGIGLLVPTVLGTADHVAVTVAVFGAFLAATASAAVVQTVSMDYARPATAGTDFTLIVSVAQFWSFVIGAGALYAAAQFGYQPVMWAAVALVALAGLLGTRHLSRHQRFLESAAELHH